MLNHQGQGPNQIESPGNLLQQQPPNFDVQVRDGLNIFLNLFLKCLQIKYIFNL